MVRPNKQKQQLRSGPVLERTPTKMPYKTCLFVVVVVVLGSFFFGGGGGENI